MRTIVCSFLAVLLLGIVVVPKARASEWDQLTRFTFNQPVEVPGQILPAGTYWFQLLESPANRNIVMVYNHDQTQLCATFVTASAWRYDTTYRTEMTFAERRHERPEAILTWYYPGMRIGHEFLYPSAEEKHLERDTTQQLLLPRTASSGHATASVHSGE